MVTGLAITELDRLAVLRSVDIVSGVKPAHLDLPTPCARWSLRELLEHMIAQHHGFAAAAHGLVTRRADWRPRPLGPDPVAEYAAAAERVILAFGAGGVLDREFCLPEIRDGGYFPARMGIGCHFVDYVVHGWDVAATLGVEIEFEPAVLAAAVEVAKTVPGGQTRLRVGAAFAPAVPAPDDASSLDTVLALLGRSPAWPG